MFYSTNQKPSVAIFIAKPTPRPDKLLSRDNDNFTEIVSGDLKPGDQVITAEQIATDSKTVMPSLRL